MKRNLTILAVIGLFAGLLLVPAASSMGMFGSNFRHGVARAQQLANSNIGQNADIFAPGPGNVFVNQTANSNIQQNADVASRGGTRTGTQQEANSNIQQDTHVFAPGPGNVYVGQNANSNIQQNADVKNKHTSPSHEQGTGQYGVCVIGVDSPCNGDYWKHHDTSKKPQHTNYVDRGGYHRPYTKSRTHDNHAKKPVKHHGKRTICHRPPGNPSNAHAITVGKPAVHAHLNNHPDSYRKHSKKPCRIDP